MCAACGIKTVMLSCGLFPASRFIGSEASWKGLLACQVLQLFAIISGLPCRAQEVIHGWLFSVLGLEACERGHTVN